jgi:hypothetical protein
VPACQHHNDSKYVKSLAEFVGPERLVEVEERLEAGRARLGFGSGS